MEKITELRTFADAAATRLGLEAGQTFWGNTVGEYLWAAAVFFLGLFIFKTLQWLVLRWASRLAEKTATDLDDTFIKIVRRFSPPFYAFLAFWFAVQTLTVAGLFDKLVTVILITWAVYQAVIAAGILTEDVLFKRFARESDPTTKSALRIVVGLLKGALWGLGLILLLSNLGVDVGALLAGVGIGGLAIAFALQGILSDLFASFSIYFDKPFKVGDFIIVGESMGTVKKIGIQTTRLTALSGEELVLANQELIKSRIQNYRLMEERRVTFTFGILYSTPKDTLGRIGGIIKEIIEGIDTTRFDRAHFKSFGDSSYDFEAVYYVLDPDYNLYMDIQEKINLAIVERFEKEDIGFAFPSRTIYAAEKLQD